MNLIFHTDYRRSLNPSNASWIRVIISIKLRSLKTFQIFFKVYIFVQKIIFVSFVLNFVIFFKIKLKLFRVFMKSKLFFKMHYYLCTKCIAFIIFTMHTFPVNYSVSVSLARKHLFLQILRYKIFFQKYICLTLLISHVCDFIGNENPLNFITFVVKKW